jgi:hypothetical protein
MENERKQTIKATERAMKKKCKACGGRGKIRSNRGTYPDRPPYEMCTFCLGTGLEEDVEKRTANAMPSLRITLGAKYRGF